MRKFLSVFLAIALVFSVTAPTSVDAAKRGGYSSGVKKYNSTPNKSSNMNKSSNHNNSTNSSTKKPNNTTTATTKKPSTGKSFMKGMMVGGLAGMLFGGLGSMGIIGSIIGLMINMLAIAALVMVVMVLFRKIRNRKKPANTTGRWNG
ncbi:hypothetical protein [Paenibacillus marinisediminis]